MKYIDRGWGGPWAGFDHCWVQNAPIVERFLDFEVKDKDQRPNLNRNLFVINISSKQRQIGLVDKEHLKRICQFDQIDLTLDNGQMECN